MVFRMGMGPESPLPWLEPGSSSGGGRALKLILLVLLVAGAVGVVAYALGLGR